MRTYGIAATGRSIAENMRMVRRELRGRSSGRAGSVRVDRRAIGDGPWGSSCVAEAELEALEELNRESRAVMAGDCGVASG